MQSSPLKWTDWFGQDLSKHGFFCFAVGGETRMNSSPYSHMTGSNHFKDSFKLSIRLSIGFAIFFFLVSLTHAHGSLKDATRRIFCLQKHIIYQKKKEKNVKKMQRYWLSAIIQIPNMLITKTAFGLFIHIFFFCVINRAAKVQHTSTNHLLRNIRSGFLILINLVILPWAIATKNYRWFDRKHRPSSVKGKIYI